MSEPIQVDSPLHRRAVESQRAKNPKIFSDFVSTLFVEDIGSRGIDTTTPLTPVPERVALLDEYFKEYIIPNAKFIDPILEVLDPNHELNDRLLKAGRPGLVRSFDKEEGARTRGLLEGASPEEQVEFCRWYAEKLIERRKTLEALIPGFEARFIDDIVQRAIPSGLPISEEKVRTKMATLRHAIVDPLDLLFKRYGTLADYNEQTESARYSADWKDKEDLYHSFAHESFHHLSGRTVIMVDNSKPDKPKLKYLRLGFDVPGSGFYSRFAKSQNEAITEQLAILDVHGFADGLETNTFAQYAGDTGSYTADRGLKEAILTSGGQTIPFILDLGGYYEDFDSAKDANTMAESLRFIAAIDEAYEPGFYFKIVEFVRSKNRERLVRGDDDPFNAALKDTADVLRKNWREIAYQADKESVASQPYRERAATIIANSADHEHLGKRVFFRLSDDLGIYVESFIDGQSEEREYDFKIIDRSLRKEAYCTKSFYTNRGENLVVYKGGIAPEHDFLFRPGSGIQLENEPVLEQLAFEMLRDPDLVAHTTKFDAMSLEYISNRLVELSKRPDITAESPS